jgi:hypothetical protein
MTPAQLISTSSPPSEPARALMPPLSRTSSLCGDALPRTGWDAAAATSASVTPVTITSAPASRKPHASPAPMPDVPPVTSTRLPAYQIDAQAPEAAS